MKTNITRPIDTQHGYDLEIETSFTRADGLMCAALLNGEQIQMFYGVNAESDAKARLYSEVTHQIQGGAQPIDDEPEITGDDSRPASYYDTMSNLYEDEGMQNHHTYTQPTPKAPATYAQLVEARESAYIAQRDAERELTVLKARLTADIAADPSFKNDTARKAELTDRLYGYDIFIDFDSIADAYRKAIAAIEVYQEAAKDARAKLRYETAQMELEAAKLQLQVAQAKHDAAEPTDEDAYGNMPHQKPDAIKPKSIAPNFETQHSWVLDVWNALSTIPSGDSAGYVTKCIHDGRVRNELIIDSEGQVVVFENEGDCQDYAFAMRDLHGFGEWSVREVWYERPF